MIRPIDLKDDDFWNLMVACNSGDFNQVKTLVARRPQLVFSEYDYTPALHFAVRAGHLEITRFLLDNGANSTYQTHPFFDSLVTMAQDREYSELAGYLRNLAARQFPIADGVAGFLDAAQRGEVARLQVELAREPALARASNDTGDTALHRTAAAGQLHALNLLLDAGAEPDAVRADGKRPINCALSRPNSARLGGVLAGILLARGARYNVYLAAVFGDSEYVAQELARDPSLANFEDSSHQRPISAAAWRNDLEMVKVLLNHGADPSLPEHGAPLGLALWIAVYQEHTAMAKLLLEHGANPNTSPESSGSALMHARRNPELKQLLIEHGAKEDRSDLKRLEEVIGDNDLARVEQQLQELGAAVREPLAFWGEGILAAPANGANREMIELLIRHGARVPEISKWGQEYYFKHLEIAQLLLERGASPNHRNWQGITMLHHMARRGDVPMAKLLLDHGADIDALDDEYRSTPLGYSARWGQLEVATLLLERGADPNNSGAPWATPLAWARKKNRPGLETMLLAAGARE